MNKLVKNIFLLIVVLFIQVSDSFSIAVGNEESYKSIYVLKHIWHTGVIFDVNDIEESFPFLQKDFNEPQFIEIGWGDKDFYMAEKETVWLALKAAFWPTKSVLHVAEIKSQQIINFKEGEIIKLQLTEMEYKNLLSYFGQSFYVDEFNENKRLGEGLYGASYFYLSNEKYHLLKTCNVWLAKGLKKANVSIKPFFAFTSKNVMKQLQN